MNDYDGIFTLIFNELHKAEMKHAGWPEDLIHAAAIIGEESGELTQACLDDTYDKRCPDRIRREAAQVAAMGIRFLINMEDIT